LRTDHATLFPGYANSATSAGSYAFDSTAYANGMHNIAWVLTDNLGRVDGIGSRFFHILNAAPAAAAAQFPAMSDVAAQRALRPGKARPERVAISAASYPAFRRGYDPNAALNPIRQAGEGLLEPVELNELDRLEIHLPAGEQWTAGLRVGGELRELPIGSTFDAEERLFNWQLGPGFLGEFLLEFRAAEGTVLPIPVRVGIPVAPVVEE